MPTFYVWPRCETEHDSFWIYAIDDFDARQQIASTLKIDSNNEDIFGCDEDHRFKMPLNKILHNSGEWTEVPPPVSLEREADDGAPVP
jgi:hypothetical protein